MDYNVTYYPKLEEKLNIYSHGLGMVLSLIAFPFLIYKAILTNDLVVVLSAIIYGTSMIILYTASTLFHSAVNKKYRYYLNIFDHSAIYILIAGTYAPIALVVLQGTLGWVIFGVSWVLAILGVFFKVFFIGRYQIMSIATYIIMGWMIVFAFKPLIENFAPKGLQFLALGGVSYSIGALFFILNKVPYNHAVFHVFVLLGSLSHFLAIYLYVI
jgi:hemolysin III